MQETFIELCLAGKALLSDVNSHVEAWEKSSAQISLSEFLGMTEDEYVFWDGRIENLRIIIAARDRCVHLSQMKRDAGKIHYSARVTPVREKEEVEDWLRANGYLPS